MNIAEILQFFESWAPLSTQENWDNSGLILGEPDIEISEALLSLDCTMEVLEEAAATGCNLVICHHPPVFQAIKRFQTSDPSAALLIYAIRHQISILALHTNLDHAYEGVSHEIGQKLGLKGIQTLQKLEGKLIKIQTFCPLSHADVVRSALFQAGAGELQGYTTCSFNSTGTGTFTPSESSNPFSGIKGGFHEEAEIKIECILPLWLKSNVISALHAAHPYEVPAYDLIALENSLPTAGAGITGYLPESMPVSDFLSFLSLSMKAPSIRHTISPKEKIRKVACCGGSGSFLLAPAIEQGCDVLITADFKYHQFFDALGHTMVADIGHYESEQFTPELIHKKLSERFPIFALRLSKLNTNPIYYYTHGYNG